MKNKDVRYDVAIVGFGPTGAVAAGLLGAMGIRTFVCDKQSRVYDKPRAISLDHEIIRLFQQMGVAKRIKPFVEPFTDSVYYGVDGQVIKRMSTVAPPYPLAHTPSIVFTQPPAERVLREHAQSFDCVTIQLNCTLKRLTQGEEGATLFLNQAGKQPFTVRARYVIGCDGASSTVRAQAGIELEDLDFDEAWLVVDALINDRGKAKLPTTSVQYCNPERPSTYLICPGSHRRWEISINSGEDPQELASPAGTWKLLAPWISRRDGKLWRQASYRFHALVASQWCKGCVFLAGDAAHQQPPFLGQGMCQGLRDVANLSWKLQAVLKGFAPERLLHSYEPERKHHVIDLTTRIKAIGQIISERDPEKARARDAKLLQECGGVVKPTPRQDVQPALRAGFLSPGLMTGVGKIFPQPWFYGPEGAEAQRMDDVMGYGWRLILSRGADAKLASYARSLKLPGLTVVQMGKPGSIELNQVAQGWFKQNGCSYAWVRPDHYVYGVGSTMADLTDHLKALCAF